MANALDDFEVEGIGHNLPFLSAVMNQKRFRSGKLTTAYIAEEFPNGFCGVEPGEDAVRTLVAVAAYINMRVQKRAALISGALANHPRAVGSEWVVSIAGSDVTVSVTEEGSRTTVGFGDAPVTVSSRWLPGKSHAAFEVDGKVVGIKTDMVGSGWRLRWRGIDLVARIRTPRAAELARLMPTKLPPDTSKMLLCPMPGVVTAIFVSEGDRVEAGQALAAVEAMKMENVLRAEKRGIVKKVAVETGASLAVDQLILEFE
jgi:propionyl-CoA carboxylase alpha chain